MQIPLSQLNNTLLSKVGGRAQSNIPNLYAMYQETVWRMQGRVDLASSIRLEPFVNPLYESTGTIVLPEDFSLQGLIAIRPQDPTMRTPYNVSIGSNQWDAEQLFYTSSMGIQNGVQYLNTKLTLPPPTVIATFDDDTTGLYMGLGATTDIRTDTQYYIQGSGSVAFTAGAGTVNGFEVVFDTAVSITGLENVLVWVEMPASDAEVVLTVGSSSGNIYYKTLTASYFNQPFKAGWNLLRLDLSNAEIIGTPDLSSITYFKIEPLADIADTAVYRVDGLVATPDAFVNLEYYSNSLFVNAQGQRLSIPSSPTDYILLNDKEYPLFINQFSEVANTDVRPTGAATALAMYGGTRLDNAYAEYQQMYPSRRIWTADSYSSGRSGAFRAPWN